jgi:Family of unknown function (DUF5681)
MSARKEKVVGQVEERAFDNAVGYCRPPKHTQFKAGQSGNPKGRPKGTISSANFLRKILKEIVSDP